MCPSQAPSGARCTSRDGLPAAAWCDVSRGPASSPCSRARSTISRECVGELCGCVVERAVRADVQRVCAVHPLPDRQLAEHQLRVGGQVAVDPHLPAVDVDQRRWSPRSCRALARSGWRRRRISRSISASVPAVRRCAPVGSLTAPTRSAMALISRRAAGLAASSV